MNQLDKIVEEYASADEERRLSMFLSHRSLRNRFIEIDRSESDLAARTQPSDLKERRAFGWSRLCPQWLRSCCYPHI